ncbi:MAG: Methyl-coenzyme M reductase I operon protein D [Candidatus Methanolliviera sp. GoM_oil]|nr:MAG: Methyl-coenzyme M reductase I operon protein D [Candidatus Methanolliviera sp. GoM_oil]
MEHETEPNQEIKVTPGRLPSAGTIEAFLNKISALKGAVSVTLSGTPIHYESWINVGERSTPLKIQVQRAYIEMEEINDDRMQDVKDLCSEVFPYGFETEIGIFRPTKETLASEHSRSFARIDIVE